MPASILRRGTVLCPGAPTTTIWSIQIAGSSLIRSVPVASSASEKRTRRTGELPAGQRPNMVPASTMAGSCVVMRYRSDSGSIPNSTVSPDIDSTSTCASSVIVMSWMRLRHWNLNGLMRTPGSSGDSCEQLRLAGSWISHALP
eukprot:1079725-Rhodomonas_salina.1